MDSLTLWKSRYESQIASGKWGIYYNTARRDDFMGISSEWMENHELEVSKVGDFDLILSFTVEFLFTESHY